MVPKKDEEKVKVRGIVTVFPHPFVTITTTILLIPPVSGTVSLIASTPDVESRVKGEMGKSGERGEVEGGRGKGEGTLYVSPFW